MFHFRLQPVLDYRKLLEDKLMLEFADMKRRLDGEKETLERLRREMANLISQLRERGENRLSAPDVSFYLSYIITPAIEHVNFMRHKQPLDA